MPTLKLVQQTQADAAEKVQDKEEEEKIQLMQFQIIFIFSSQLAEAASKLLKTLNPTLTET